MLYEIAVIEEPTTKEAEEGKLEKLVLQPTCVVAKDEPSAVMKLMQEESHAKLKVCDPNRTKVLVRPFIQRS